MQKSVTNYVSAIGRRGGQRSRRLLSTEEAKAMVAVRLARQAFRQYRIACFWSFRDVEITRHNAGWVAEQLRRNGNREAWNLAARIERLLGR